MQANVSESVRKTRDFVFQLAMSYLQHMASKTLIPDGDGQFKDLKSEMHKPMKDILLDADLLKNSVMHEKAELSLELQVAVLQATEAVWENTGKMNGTLHFLSPLMQVSNMYSNLQSLW